jgi:hypothetical protein
MPYVKRTSYGSGSVPRRGDSHKTPAIHLVGSDLLVRIETGSSEPHPTSDKAVVVGCRCSIHGGTWMMLISQDESVGTDVTMLQNGLAEQLAWRTTSRFTEAFVAFASRNESEHTQ